MITATGLSATPAVADDTSVTIAVAEAATGTQVRVTDDPVAAHGVTINTAKVDGKKATTPTASKADGAGVMAVLDEGDNEATFNLDLPKGAKLEKADDGAILVASVGDEAVTINAVIQKPWAKDATGKALPTSYRVQGDTLIQTVDTTNAKFPDVADPWITGWGAWYGNPVVYVQWSKSETLAVHELAQSSATPVLLAYVCSRIPNSRVVTACLALALVKLDDLKATAKYAANNGRCLKARFPIPFSGISLLATDFYSKTC